MVTSLILFPGDCKDIITGITVENAHFGATQSGDLFSYLGQP